METEEEEVPEGSGGLPLELLASYAKFGRGALRKHWLLSSFVLVLGLSLTGLACVYAPRTYVCTTVLMSESNPVLDGNSNTNGLIGATNQIMRHENVERLVEDADLVNKVDRKPPLLRLKDRIVERLFGKPSPKDQHGMLVGTLESKLSVFIDGSGNLVITVEWSDPKTAAELAELTRESFLKSRRAAEISAFEEKMQILDAHASRMRGEVESLAQQINNAQTQRVADATKASAPGKPGTMIVRRAAAHSLEPDAQLPAQKERLAELKRQLADREGDRDRRLREEQAKLSELKLKYTPSHPEVVTQQERIAILSQVPPELTMLRGEVADLEALIKERSSLSGQVAAGAAVTSVGATAPTGGAALPADIMRALQTDNADPAVTAQLSGAVVRYGALQDEMRSARIQLDTAEAAFQRRYKIVLPAEVPWKPTKPKLPVIFGAGFAASLLLALLLPLISELRKGMIVERWQVHNMKLPILGELKLPPHSVD